MSLDHLEFIHFDIDGTLCDYGADPHSALDEVCRKLSIEVSLDPEEYYELYKVVNREAPDGSYEEISNEAYRRLLEKAGIPDAALALRVGEEYREARLASLRLYPETLTVIENLAERYRLGIISNGPGEIQRAKLERFGLKGFFDSVVISGEVGVEKPDTAIFRLALERSGAQAAQSAHVGDSLEHDVKGAVRAGLLSLWINRRVLPLQGVDVAPHYAFPRLDGILSLLGR